MIFLSIKVSTKDAQVYECARNKRIVSPKIPPIRLKKIASNRNWNKDESNF
jgi:hypothetical protein